MHSSEKAKVMRACTSHLIHHALRHALATTAHRCLSETQSCLSLRTRARC
jgi:hypothetical protein